MDTGIRRYGHLGGNQHIQWTSGGSCTVRLLVRPLLTLSFPVVDAQQRQRSLLPTSSMVPHTKSTPDKHEKARAKKPKGTPRKRRSSSKGSMAASYEVIENQGFRLKYCRGGISEHVRIVTIRMTVNAAWVGECRSS